MPGRAAVVAPFEVDAVRDVGVLGLDAAPADQAPVVPDRLVLNGAEEALGQGFEVAPGLAVVV